MQLVFDLAGRLIVSKKQIKTDELFQDNYLIRITTDKNVVI